jgi:hypothetical protein
MRNNGQGTGHSRQGRDGTNGAEETLRLIARLPAPEGLVERVQTGLRTAPRTAQILHWPLALRPATGLAGNLRRGAAAAAIVFVVAGGGWGIYSHVTPSEPARVVVMPPRVGASGGFSSAGAMRTPDTLNGPVLLHAPQSAPAATVKKPVRRAANKTAAKPAARVK